MRARGGKNHSNHVPARKKEKEGRKRGLGVKDSNNTLETRKHKE